MEGPLQGVIGSSAVGGAADAKALRAVTEDAGIQESPVDVAGMTLRVDEAHDAQKAAQPAAHLERPLILAIESSCDETAAAIVDGKGNLLSDVVASQIDFHARFGGVVPEIASRKHIEAICGVCDECLDVAGAALGHATRLAWSDLDARGRHVRAPAWWVPSWWAWRSPRALAVGRRPAAHWREPPGGPPRTPTSIGAPGLQAPPAVVSPGLAAATPCSFTCGLGRLRGRWAPPSTTRWARRSTRLPRRWAWDTPAAPSSRRSARQGQPARHRTSRAP